MDVTKITKSDVKIILEQNKYILNYINFQNNSINGICYRKKQKYFFKIMEKVKSLQERAGYKEIKEKYPVSKLVDFVEYHDLEMLVYEYDDTIKHNKGLLHDFILECDEKKLFEKDLISNIFQYYDKSLKNLKKVDNYPMQEFYDNRVQSRLIAWYEDWQFNQYKIIINENIIINLKEVTDSTIEFFKVPKKYIAFYSQGDPNTLNIGMKPNFMDLTTAGCNYVGAEIAAFIWSELIADIYFCPKYHKDSYKNHEKIVGIYRKYKPELQYSINKEEKIIKINGKIKTTRVRKEILAQYIDIFKKNNIEIKSELRYYVIMRILCIFNVKKMEEFDIIYSFFCIGIFNYLLQKNTNKIVELLEDYIEEV